MADKTPWSEIRQGRWGYWDAKGNSTLSPELIGSRLGGRSEERRQKVTRLEEKKKNENRRIKNKRGVYTQKAKRSTPTSLQPEDPKIAIRMKWFAWEGLYTRVRPRLR